jgi:hypothetical protein
MAAKKSASRKSAAKKAAKTRKPRAAAKKAAATSKKRAAAKKSLATRKTKAPAPARAKTALDTNAPGQRPRPSEVPPAIAELDQRIAITRNNLRELVEQAAAYSGAANEELISQRIAEQEAKLELLRKQREKLSQGRW